VVSATNSAGESGNSSEVSATVTPVAPWNLMAVASNGQITLSWTACAWATNYNVKRSTSSGTETTITTSTTLTYADTNVVNGTKYYYVVSGLDATGEGGNSSEVSATPGGAAAASPILGGITFGGGGGGGGGGFGFTFTNIPGASFTVHVTTNLTLPLSNWTVLGQPVEVPTNSYSQYQFTDA
jgi:hypothetical protein